MPTQKICLKWNSFQSNILTSFENLWEEEGFVDVTLASDGQCIRAHKVILSACSPFFKKIFESNPCQHPVVILQDVHFSEVESLLNFVYKGEVHIDEENLPALLRAAETLQIRGLSGASDHLKQKTTVLKKSNVDGAPPLKRMRQILKPPRSPGQSSLLASPGPPSAPRLQQLAAPTTEHAYTQPYKSTFLTKEEFVEHVASQQPLTLPPRPQHFTTPPAEHSQTHPYELTFATKQEMLDHDAASPDQHLEEAYEESNDDSMDLMAKHMAMETEQLNGNGDLLSYEKLPYGCLLPRAQVLTTWAKSRTLEQLACDLMKILFTTEERVMCNVNGKMGKRQFNVHKVQLMREALHHYSGLPAPEFEEQWKICVTKIDTANRGLKRNLVLKGRKAICLL